MVCLNMHYVDPRVQPVVTCCQVCSNKKKQFPATSEKGQARNGKAYIQTMYFAEKCIYNYEGLCVIRSVLILINLDQTIDKPSLNCIILLMIMGRKGGVRGGAWAPHPFNRKVSF